MNLPKIDRNVAHPQSVWFEEHWRPLFNQLEKEYSIISQERNYSQEALKKERAFNKELESEITALKSKIAKAKEALKQIQQPFNNETNYIDRAVRAQEKAWDVLREIGEG